jgi:hypothetical protein
MTESEQSMKLSELKAVAMAQLDSSHLTSASGVRTVPGER